jgi:type I restriction enzyme S subunit
MVALAEVAEISGGITKNAKRSALAIQRPYLSVANVHFNRIDINNLSNIGVNEAEITRAQLMPGDLMVVEGNGSLSQLGRVAIWHGQVSGCLHQNHLIKVRPKPTVKSKWLLYWLMSSAGREAIEATASSTSGLHTLSLAKVGSLPAPIASLEEQEAAIAYIDLHLSRLDEAVTTLQGIQAKLKQARASILKAAVEGRLVETEAEMARRKGGYYEDAEELLERVSLESSENHLCQIKTRQGYALTTSGLDPTTLPDVPDGWAWCRIDAIGSVQLGRQRTPKDHSGPHMCPYMRVANVFEARIDLADVKEMNFTPNEQEIYGLKYGDILLNEGQSPHLVGRPAMWRCEVSGACFQNTLVRFSSSAAVLPAYALLVFRAQLHARRYMKIAKITTNIAHLGAQRFAAVEFPLAPLAEQQRIVDEVDRRFSVLDQVEATVTTSLARCSKLRQAILKQAFEGRLVPVA